MIRVLESVRHDGKEYKPNDIITEIKEDEAARLIRLGVASKTPPADKEPENLEDTGEVQAK